MRVVYTPMGIAVAMFVGAVTASAQAQGVTVVPTFSVSETITDNRDLRSADKQSEAITRISPGVRMSSRSGRVQGTLDYSLNALVYARDSTRNDVQHALAAGVSAEAIEKHAFIDARAAISQQSISAFGVQTPTATTINANRTEVRSLSVSPSLRGTLGDLADLEARATWGTTTNGSTRAADSTNTSISVRASGQRGPLGWSADVSESTSDFDGGRKTKQGRVGMSLNYRLDVDLRASLRAGRESNDVISTQQQKTNSWGAGLDWTPTARTQISLQRDRRFFGNGHSFSVQHRLQRSVWHFSDSRDISSNGVGNPGTAVLENYDQLFAQYATSIPDPIQRELFVRGLLASRQGFLTNAVTVQRRQQASVSLQGLRTNVSLTAYATESRRLDGASTAVDDLSLGSVLRQRGSSFTVGYQLTPSSNVNFGYNRSATGGSSTQAGTSQQSYTMSLSSQVSSRTSLSLNLRHVVFDSTVQPYTENGATASLSVRF